MADASNNTEYDITIIGAGPGGYAAALYGGLKGVKIALVEKDRRLGGTCLLRGCIPSKAMLKTGELRLQMSHAEKYGLALKGDVSIDWESTVQRKDKVVDGLVNGLTGLMKSRKVDVIHGTGTITSPNTVTVDGREIRSRNIIIATGSGTLYPTDVPGGDLPNVITSDEVLDADLTLKRIPTMPESVIIVGGGTVGMEHASMFNAYGVKVTVVVTSPRALRLVDEEISRRFSMVVKNQGIEIITRTDVVRMEETGKGKGKRLMVTLRNADSGAEEVREVSHVFWAKGRFPYSQGVGLDKIGLQTTKRGFIEVDERMQTAVPGVYAIGDVVPGPMLAHVAMYEGEVAVDNILGHYRAADYGAVPDVIFTIPEIASVGMQESEAKERGIPVKVTKFNFAALGRAQAIGEPDGLVKMICDPGSGVILGMQILGAHASDVIAECTLAVQQGITAEELAHTIHAHPTMPEAVAETAFSQILGAPLHANR
ncbi:MAG TPA: dihydrolipoyl dehydrogenase [Chloroflexia bacterium]|nr:dihydrolipoyl dehydrogenase [Chloroflexia bacterium]